MSKHLMYVVALALSIAVAACATRSQPAPGHRTSVLAADALQRGKAAYDRQDYVTALQEWRPLAQQGIAWAQYNLGVMYADGQGVAKDEAEAVRWYRLAAAQGKAQAHHNLGFMYEHGRGVTRDLMETQREYARAAELFPPGPKRIAAIEARDRVARQLASTQVHSAQLSPPTPPVIPSNAPVGSQGPPPSPPTNPRPSVLDAEEVPLVKVGGVYALPVEINGVLRLRFVLDSGAAEVNIPADVVFTLLRSGTITDADFLPGKTYILADGSELKSPRFIVRNLKIGRHHITNVPASVGNLAGDLLLGQSLLERLGAWGIDNQRKVLIIRPGTP